MKNIIICTLTVLLLMAGCAKKAPPAEGSEKPVPGANITIPEDPDMDVTVPEAPTQDFTLTVTCSDSTVDVSNFDIDIFALSRVFDPTYSGGYRFDSEYAFTVKPRDGVAVFKRPSEYFSIQEDTSTLPEGYRIEAYSGTVEPDTNTSSTVLKKRYYIPDKNAQPPLVLQYETYHKLCKSLFNDKVYYE